MTLAEKIAIGVAVWLGVLALFFYLLVRKASKGDRK